MGERNRNRKKTAFFRCGPILMGLAVGIGAYFGIFGIKDLPTLLHYCVFKPELAYRKQVDGDEVLLSAYPLKDAHISLRRYLKVRCGDYGEAANIELLDFYPEAESVYQSDVYDEAGYFELPVGKENEEEQFLTGLKADLKLALLEYEEEKSEEIIFSSHTEIVLEYRRIWNAKEGRACYELTPDGKLYEENEPCGAAMAADAEIYLNDSDADNAQREIVDSIVKKIVIK